MSTSWLPMLAMVPSEVVAVALVTEGVSKCLQSTMGEKDKDPGLGCNKNQHLGRAKLLKLL